jgi:uncharacterized membrane protein (DUF485 family)
MSLTSRSVEPSPQAIVQHRRHVGWVLFSVAVILLIGWPIAIVMNQEFLSIPTPIYIVVLLALLAVIILWVRWEILVLTTRLRAAEASV